MTYAIRVRCMYPFGDRTRSELKKLSSRLDISFTAPDGQAEVDTIVDGDLEVLLSNYRPTDLSRLPALKWFATSGAGIEHLRAIDLAARGITITNASGLSAPAMAEFAISGILLFSQRTVARLESQKQRKWPVPWVPEWLGLLGTGLRGSTLTVVGYGSVGREVARLASAFGMRILAVKAKPETQRDSGYSLPGTGDPEGQIPERFAGLSQIADCFAESDYVVISVPLTPNTERLIGRPALAALPRQAVLVNIARGRVIDEDALLGALRAGGLRGAVLDVVVTEPLPTDSPVWDVPNLILAPHVSGINDPTHWYDTVATLMKENLRRYAAGDPLVNVVDAARGY